MSLNNDQFSTYVNKGIAFDEDLDISLEPSPEQQILLDRITNEIRSYQFEVNDEDNDSFEESTNCKYYSANAFKKENFSNSDNFSILHLNIHSIERHFDEIQILIHLLNFEFDILCFSESKLLHGTNPKTSIFLEGYQEPIGMPTKATKGGVLIYVKNGINFVPHVT